MFNLKKKFITKCNLQQILKQEQVKVKENMTIKSNPKLKNKEKCYKRKNQQQSIWN